MHLSSAVASHSIATTAKLTFISQFRILNYSPSEYLKKSAGQQSMETLKILSIRVALPFFGASIALELTVKGGA